MKIIVLMKQVPDTYGDRKLNTETGLADRDASEAVLDEITERALEVALTYSDENPGTEIVVLSVGPSTVSNSLTTALAMGADKAVHVLDDDMLGADISLTAEVLAAAIREIGFDLVLTGNLSTDGSGGVMPSVLAEMLNVSALTNLSTLSIAAGAASGVRAHDYGTMTVSAQLPAVASITEAMPEPRFPNFRGIMAAKKKPFKTLSLTDLNIDAQDESKGRSIVIGIAERPPRTAGIKISDDGSAAEQLADFLVQNRLV